MWQGSAKQMLEVLLAQLISPPLQPGPARLPGPGRVEEHPAPVLPSPLAPTPPAATPPAATPAPAAPVAPETQQPLPRVLGLELYGPAEQRRILRPCAAIVDPSERLQACAAALTTRLTADGYGTSRVYAVAEPAPGVLEVVMGRLVEVRISSDSPSLTRRLQRLLLPLQGEVLHLPSLERDLLQAKRLPGLGQLRANLNRLGGDSTKAVLEVVAEAGATPLQGDLSLRNDGNSGSGQFRGLATLAKEGLLLEGDSLLLYGEVDTDSNPDLGYSSGSLSYRLPLGPDLGFSTAFGASRRNLIEAPEPYDGLSYRQLQLLGQFDWTFQQSLRSRWYAFAGLSLNRNDAYLDGRSFPGLVGGGAEGQLNTGFLRAGIGWEGMLGAADLAGSIYGLQGLAGLSSAGQRQELAAFAGVNPGEARALGGQLGAAWRLGPRWNLQLIGAGQIALAPLTEPMGFSLGSDNGLRGLPGQVVSGDSGLLGSAELSWSAWRQGQAELQLVPFLGAGLVHSQFPEGSVSDSIGAGGLLLRWLQGRNWLVELGWVSQFGSAGQNGWDDWLLGSGLYTKVAYRF